MDIANFAEINIASTEYEISQKLYAHNDLKLTI